MVNFNCFNLIFINLRVFNIFLVKRFVIQIVKRSIVSDPPNSRFLDFSFAGERIALDPKSGGLLNAAAAAAVWRHRDVWMDGWMLESAGDPVTAQNHMSHRQN